MPRLIAIEWNESEARLAVAAKRGKEVSFEHAFAVDLRGDSAGQESHQVDVAQRLTAALAARGLGKADALVAIGRTNIELRQLNFPPAPDDELPDMVRFQALREFNALDEDWPLDFFPLGDDPAQPRAVLAAAINPEQVEQIAATCRAAGLTPRRLLLRPCEAASLLSRARPSSGLRLLVDLLRGEADLTVMLDRTVVFVRSARLPGDPVSQPEAVPALVSEIRRTMAAAQNQLGGRRVESLVLCGHGDDHAALAARMERELDVPAELFDLFDGLRLAGDLKRGLPTEPGRFAPLLGALSAEFADEPHTIDFLHPRRRPEPPSRQNTYALALVAGLLLVAAVLGYGYVRKSGLEQDVKRLQAEALTLDREVAKATKLERSADEIRKWTSADTVWLDELDWLSRNLPPAQESMLTELRMVEGRSGGQLSVEGFARSVETLEQMEEKVRGPERQVVGKGKALDATQKPYGYNFSSTILLVKPVTPAAKPAVPPAATAPAAVAANARPAAAKAKPQPPQRAIATPRAEERN